MRLQSVTTIGALCEQFGESQPPARCGGASATLEDALARRGLPRIRVGLCRQLDATLAAARSKDGTAGAGAHAKTEAVLLGPPAVVRLERALAHGSLRGKLAGAMPGKEVWSPTGNLSILREQGGAVKRPSTRIAHFFHAAPSVTIQTCGRCGISADSWNPASRNNAFRLHPRSVPSS